MQKVFFYSFFLLILLADINIAIKTCNNVMGTIDKLQRNGIFFNYEDVIFLCERYCIIELSIFGSSIRDDFTPDSDVDMLVAFDERSKITLFDIMDLEKEFSQLFKRKVDVVEKKSLKNPIRRNKILSTLEKIYAA